MNSAPGAGQKKKKNENANAAMKRVSKRVRSIKHYYISKVIIVNDHSCISPDYISEQLFTFQLNSVRI